MTSKSINPKHNHYWEDYSNLQHVKHRLIEEYLKGWYPKLGSWAKRVLYIDTHAGKGRHAGGQAGSPIVALQTLLQHNHLQRLLRNCEFRFIFIEESKSNIDFLENEIANLGDLPRGIEVQTFSSDFQTIFDQILRSLNQTESKLAPSFIFVDPFGFKIPYSLLSRYMHFDGVELLINIMWRELDMCIKQSSSNPSMKKVLNEMFGLNRWERLVKLDEGSRASKILEMIGAQLRAKWSTSIEMSDKGRIRYFLSHFTNHETGRDLMKQVLWKVSHHWNGEFIARKTDNPSQGVLLKTKPELEPLKRIIISNLKNGPKKWQSLTDIIRETIWLPKHLKDALRDLKNIGDLLIEGKFSATANPLIRLANK